MELAQLVSDAQRGDAEARREVILRFENFLIKYRSFFRSESDAIRLARQYPDVAAFLGLFMGKKSYHAVQSRKWSPSLSTMISRKVKEIVELAAEIGEPADMDVIIDLTFFEMLMKYDPKGKVRKELKKQGIEYDLLSRSQQRKYEAAIPPVGFEGYLINVFKWRLFKNIEAETKGVIPGIGWCKAYTSGHSVDGSMDIDELTNLAEALSKDIEDVDALHEASVHIDHDWIAGLTCGEPFDELTSQERWILKMRFADRMSSREIADSVGVSPSVVRSRYNEISQKLAEALGPEYFDDLTKQSELLAKFFGTTDDPE